ncbi:MAG: hypothetical protein AUG44_22160 [Actinobacteria bacterium 13_1_20CM_3_71_11]|nr:MAG: hypothetical protein AUG44_22160 [Actinobacteria bacterium 13_1_20CM_3_71_11]
MGLQIPGELADLLNDLGYTWPKSDEERLFQLGQDWIGFASTLTAIRQDGDAIAASVTSGNQGQAIEAFRSKVSADDSASAVLDRGTTGAQVIGAGLIMCAGLVLTLKINVIIQLTILAAEIIEALATAPETFGGSLLEIPVFKKLTDMAINLLINEAMEVLLE